MIKSTDITQEESAKASSTEGHIVQTGSSSPVSFDDFESLDASDKVQAKIELKKEKAKESLKSEPKKDIKSQDAKKQAKGSEKPEDEQPAEPREGNKAAGSYQDPGDEIKEQGTEDSEKAQKVRLFKVKSGDSEVTVRSDTAFEVKVDGQKESVTLSDALNSYSGHKAVDKRMGEFGAEKQKFIEEKRIIDDTIGEMAQAITGGTPQKALMRFFEALGADPVKGISDLKKSFMADVNFEEMAQLSPEERDAQLAKPSGDFYKEHYEQQVQARKTEAENKQLNSQIDEIQKAHQIDDVTFNRVAEELFSLKEQGRFQGIITPKLIAEAAIYDKQILSAKDLLKGINPELTQNREAVEKVVALLKADMSTEDVSAIIGQKYGDSKAQPQDNLSKKLEKSTGEAYQQKESRPQNEDMWTFEQI